MVATVRTGRSKVGAERPLREVVTYLRFFDGVWPGVRECVYASVERYRHEETWLADCHMSLPNEAREQWNTVRRFATRDEAAAYAAAFVLESERIVTAVSRGGETTMPHRAMRAARASALGADAKLAAVIADGDRARSARALQDAEAAWWRAHDFRDFLRSEP